MIKIINKTMKELEIKTIEMVGLTLFTIWIWLVVENIPNIYKMLFL